MIGAGVGFALGMPLFEVFLLTTLVVDGGLLNAAVATQYFSRSANLIALLVVLHLVTAAIGAAIGYGLHRLQRRRPHLRVITGGVRVRR
jgi:hypothetical protein